LFSQYVQDRVDIQHQSTLTAEGKDTWVSGHYMMPADAGMRNEFAFWESNGSSQNVMDFWVEPKAGGGTTINFGVGFLGATKIWTADFTIGRWHQVAIHVHWSVNAQLGSVDVWYDGQQVVTAYKAKTKADGNSLFYQNGLHRRRPDNFVDTIYFDDFVEADSFAEARIAAPVQPGEDGGAAGGAGGGDGADAGGGPETTGSADGGGPAGTGGAPGSGGASGGGTGGIAGGGSGGSGGKAATGDGAGGVTGASGGVTGGGCAFAGRDPAELGAAGSLCFCLAAAAFAFGRRRAAR
ncbi:MAG TPA: heparin lyase I family protein, partial [Polyangia bacterium]|nr:heparin lyase I family protein [Polyangia bacterium]